VALVKCPRCGKPYADSWGQCPSCGIGKSGQSLSAHNRRVARLIIYLVYACALSLAAYGALSMFRGGLPSAGQDINTASNLLLGGAVLYVIARVAEFWIKRG